MPRYIYLEVNHLADKGFNKAIEVYKLTNEAPALIGANYKLDSNGWRGALTEANLIINSVCKHRITNIYGEFDNKKVKVCELGSAYR